MVVKIVICGKGMKISIERQEARSTKLLASFLRQQTCANTTKTMHPSQANHTQVVVAVKYLMNETDSSQR